MSNAQLKRTRSFQTDLALLAGLGGAPQNSRQASSHKSYLSLKDLDDVRPADRYSARYGNETGPRTFSAKDGPF